MDVAAYRYRTVPNECLLVPSTLLHVYIETIKARVHYSTFKPSIERRIWFVQNFIELSEPKAMINMEYNSKHKHWWLLWYYKGYRIVFKRNFARKQIRILFEWDVPCNRVVLIGNITPVLLRIMSGLKDQVFVFFRRCNGIFGLAQCQRQ